MFGPRPTESACYFIDGFCQSTPSATPWNELLGAYDPCLVHPQGGRGYSSFLQVFVHAVCIHAGAIGGPWAIGLESVPTLLGSRFDRHV